MKNIIFPKKLKKGDLIALVSPAGSVNEEQLAIGIKMIKDRGYEPVLSKHLFTNYSYGYNYAGTEKQRAEDLQWTFDTKEIAAVWASRGGYGCQHLLSRLDLKKFKKNPKWYIGYSDNTVIQSYLLKHGYASIHGQTIKTSSFGVSKDSYNLVFDILKHKPLSYSFKSHQLNKAGKVKGQLIGGNLALVYALLGTSYSFNFTDKILFIEEIGENYYALDRMLMSLEMAGVFKQIKGLVVGGMTNMGSEKDNPHYEDSFDYFANQIIAKRLRDYKFPIVFNFPNGHIFENRPLIIGAEIQLKVGKNYSIEF